MGIREININIRANVGNVPNAMKQVASSTQQAVGSVKQVGPAVQQATKGFGDMQGAAVSGNKAINQFAQGSEQAVGKLGKFGKIFSDNRGIVFGVAGLTSAMGEAVGMMGMYGDTAERLHDAQDALNKLEEQGVTTGQAHAQAVAEVVKQQRFFNMVSRNTILSQMDMIFFSTMVVSGLVKMSSEGGMVSNVLGKLRGVFTGLNRPIQTGAGNIANFMTNMSPLPAVLKTTESGALKTGASMGQMGSKVAGVGGIMAGSVGRILAFSGALAGIGLAAAGLAMVIQSAEDMKAKLTEVFGEMIMKINQMDFAWLNLKKVMGTATQEELKMLEEVTKAQELEQKALQATGESAFTYFFNINGARDKVIAKIKELVKEEQNEGKHFQDTKPLTNLQAFNSALQERRDLVAASNQAFNDFVHMAKEVKLSPEAAKSFIDPFVNLLDLAPPVKEFLEKRLNEYYSNAGKSAQNFGAIAEAEAKKVMDAMEAIGMSGQDVLSQLTVNLPANSPFVSTIWNKAKSAVTQFNTTFKDHIEEWKTLGTLQDNAQAFFDKIFGKNTAESAAAMKLFNVEAKNTTKNMKEMADQAMITFWQQYNSNIAASAFQLTAAEEAVNSFFKINAGAMAQGADMQALFNDQIKDFSPLAQGILKLAFDKYMQNLGKRTKEQTEAQKLLNQQIEEENKIILDSVDKYQKLFAETSKHFDTSKMRMAQMEAANKIFDDTLGRIDDQAQAIKDNKLAWDSLLPSAIKNTEQSFKEVQAWAKTNDMLKSNIEWRFKLKDAYTQGLVEAKKQTEQIKLEAIAAEANRTNFINLNSAMLSGIDTSGMLTSDIQNLVKALQGGTDATARLRQEFDELSQTSLSNFDDIINADKKKDFNKNFKELDLGGVPKKLRDDIKDLFSELRQGAKDANRTSTALQVVSVALTEVGKATGEVKSSEIDKIMGKTADSLKKFAGTDLELDNLLKVPGLFEQIKFNASGIPTTIMKLTEAWKDHNITTEEYNDILAIYLNETGQAGQLTKEQIARLQEMGIEVNGATEATDNYTESMKKLSDEAVVVETIGKMWLLLTNIIAEANGLIAQNWADNMNLMIRLTNDTQGDISKLWKGLEGTLNKSNVAIANKWETAMRNVLHNSQAASSQTQSEFASLVKKLNSNFVKIANNWERAMKNVVHNAKAAASQVNSALDGIKDKVVKITYQKVGSPNAEGGVYPMAKGGLISAAGGMHVSNGPTLSGHVLYGDNSGGREINAYIPMDGHKADRIMSLINAQLGRRDGTANVMVAAGGDKDITVPIVINIGDQRLSFTRKYRIRQGRDMAQQVF